MDEERLREIVREEIARALENGRPSSVEFSENAKGERTVTVKEYGRDAAEAFSGALAAFRRGVAIKKIVGTPEDSQV